MRVSPSPSGVLSPLPRPAKLGPPEWAGLAPGTHRCSVSARPRRPCPRGRGTRRTRAAGWGAASTAGGQRCRPAGSRPLGAGQGAGGASESLGAVGRASDPLLPRLLLPAFSGAFDLTGAGCQGAPLAGARLCPPLVFTAAMAGEPWGDAPLCLRAKCHLAGQRRLQIVGAQGGRH